MQSVLEANKGTQADSSTIVPVVPLDVLEEAWQERRELRAVFPVLPQQPALILLERRQRI